LYLQQISSGFLVTLTGLFLEGYSASLNGVDSKLVCLSWTRVIEIGHVENDFPLMNGEGLYKLYVSPCGDSIDLSTLGIGVFDSASTKFVNPVLLKLLMNGL